MKLHSIHLFNAAEFSYANLTLDADSIQLAGANNVGKTRLIWTLLLLFVVDRREAAHPNFGAQESLHFYFSDPERSFIVFEGYRDEGYFYVLLKRKGEKVQYYFANREFDVNFIKRGDEILPFDVIQENPQIELGEMMNSPRDILARVITSAPTARSNRGHGGFLRLASGITDSRKFSDLYKYLFRPGKDESSLLKNGILITNGLQDEKLEFGKAANTEERNEIDRRQREVSAMKEIQTLLEPLKEKRDAYEMAKTKLLELVAGLDKGDAEKTLHASKENLLEMEKEKERLGHAIEAIAPQEKDLSEKLEKSSIALGAVNERIQQEERTLKLALEYQAQKDWIKQSKRTTEDQLEAQKKAQAEIERSTSKEDLQKQLNKWEEKEKEHQDYLDNKGDLLLMNISSDETGLIRANTFLSEAVKHLDKSTILQPMEKTADGILSINGAQIDVTSLALSSLPTLKEAERELAGAKERIRNLKAALLSHNKIDELGKEILVLKEEIVRYENQLAEIDKIPDYQKRAIDSQKEREATLFQQLETKKEKDSLIDEKDALSRKRNELITEYDRHESEIREIESWYFDRYLPAVKNAGYSLSLSGEFSHDTLAQLVKKNDVPLEKTMASFKEEEATFMNEVNNIRARLVILSVHIESAPPSEMIQEMGRRVENLEVREEELNDFIATTQGLFLNTVKQFLDKLHRVQTAVKKIERQINKYQVSNLTGIDLIFSKRKVDEITILEGMNADTLDLFSAPSGEESSREIDRKLTQYVRQEKVISLSDLFDIEIRRTKHGKEKSSGKQSNGTERMIQLMILLSMVRNMIHAEDTIPFILDEVSDIDPANQQQMLAFFKELNLLPISASPVISHAFKKIYFIGEINGKSYLDDRTAITINDKEGIDAETSHSV